MWKIRKQLEKETDNILEKKASTLAVTPIYYTFSPDIMKKICNIVHPKFYDFIYKKWENITVDECIYIYQKIQKIQKYFDLSYQNRI